ncbi:hypothetical protein HMPREF9003_0101 [Bifidobacterium dentium JCVIHMP022]|uniref:Transposase n=1 Tax=Bifidobacterium dentium JCVIHMP022 TaxID=553191 RepID=A0AB72Z4P5_9BIFI|nr:hypothetical protein HMPREF9003_0101 [Bifidobacterium dentium JCVIHMP022]
MSEATETVEGGRRGGRTVSKSTPDEVMGLACGLPLTRSVLRSVVADATPGQLGGWPTCSGPRTPAGLSPDAPG